MKFLFIVPMHISWDSFANPQFFNVGVKKKDGNSYNIPRTDLPLGPLSISAFVKKFVDTEVRLVDFNAEINALDGIPFVSFEDVCQYYLDSMAEFNPDIVGVSSLFSPSLSNFMDCGRIAKNVWPHAVVIGGGNIPTNSYRYIYNELDGSFFDALCYGEGERPVLELLQSNDKLSYFAKSSSWITKEKLLDNPGFIPRHNFIEDLDDIPFYDYELCDFKKHEINQVVASYHNLEKTRGFHIMTSRGCPFMCTFCASHQTHGRSMRYHSLERVEEDFRRLRDLYGAETVIFQDDHLMADRDRVFKILEIVKSLGLNSVYQNGLTLYALDRPMLNAFFNAGVRHLVLPVESGSEKVLHKQMRKPLKLSISERVSKDCRDLGIYTNTNILIGMPGETIQDLEDARLNLKKLTSNWFNIACASPIVGSEMHEISIRNGYISPSSLGSDYRIATITTEDFTAEFIQEYQYFMNLDLNFVHNSDIKHENWEWALKGFDNVLRLRPDHAFAHYYAALAHQGRGDSREYDVHMENYYELIQGKFWSRWGVIFDMPGVSFSGDRRSAFGVLWDIFQPYSNNSFAEKLAL